MIWTENNKNKNEDDLCLGFCFHNLFQLNSGFLFHYANASQWAELAGKCRRLSAIRAGLISVNLSLVCWQVPRPRRRRLRQDSELGAKRQRQRHQCGHLESCDLCRCRRRKGRGHCVAPPPSCLSLHSLGRSPHQSCFWSEIPVWQGSEVFKKRMGALTPHGRLNQAADSQEED